MLGLISGQMQLLFYTTMMKIECSYVLAKSLLLRLSHEACILSYCWEAHPGRAISEAVLTMGKLMIAGFNYLSTYMLGFTFRFSIVMSLVDTCAKIQNRSIKNPCFKISICLYNNLSTYVALYI